MSACCRNGLHHGLRLDRRHSKLGIHHTGAESNLHSNPGRTGNRQHQQPFKWRVSFISFPASGKRVDLFVADCNFNGLRTR